MKLTSTTKSLMRQSASIALAAASLTGAACAETTLSGTAGQTANETQESIRSASLSQNTTSSLAIPKEEKEKPKEPEKPKDPCPGCGLG